MFQQIHFHQYKSVHFLYIGKGKNKTNGIFVLDVSCEQFQHIFFSVSIYVHPLPQYGLNIKVGASFIQHLRTHCDDCVVDEMCQKQPFLMINIKIKNIFFQFYSKLYFTPKNVFRKSTTTALI